MPRIKIQNLKLNSFGNSSYQIIFAAVYYEKIKNVSKDTCSFDVIPYIKKEWKTTEENNPRLIQRKLKLLKLMN